MAGGTASGASDNSRRDSTDYGEGIMADLNEQNSVEQPIMEPGIQPARVDTIQVNEDYLEMETKLNKRKDELIELMAKGSNTKELISHFALKKWEETDEDCKNRFEIYKTKNNLNQPKAVEAIIKKAADAQSLGDQKVLETKKQGNKKTIKATVGAALGSFLLGAAIFTGIGGKSEVKIVEQPGKAIVVTETQEYKDLLNAREEDAKLLENANAKLSKTQKELDLEKKGLDNLLAQDKEEDAQYQAKISELKTKNNTLIDQNTAFAAKNTELTSILTKEREEDAKEDALYETQITELTKSNERLDSTLKDITAKLEEGKAKNTQNSTEYEAQIKKIQEYETQINGITNRLKEYEGKISELTEKLKVNAPQEKTLSPMEAELLGILGQYDRELDLLESNMGGILKANERHIETVIKHYNIGTEKLEEFREGLKEFISNYQALVKELNDAARKLETYKLNMPGVPTDLNNSLERLKGYNSKPVHPNEYTGYDDESQDPAPVIIK